MNNGGLFNSNYSSSNPFSMYNGSNSTQANLDQSLADAYSRLEALKRQQQAFSQANSSNSQAVSQQRQTVFTDIATEMKDLPEDELNFIITSKDYQKTNAKYQQEFSEFITSKFAAEYIQTENAKTLEELLGIIRKRKEQYKSKFAEDISEIREQNKNLVDKNNELAESNAALQKQLMNIQEKLSRGI